MRRSLQARLLGLGALAWGLVWAPRARADVSGQALLDVTRHWGAARQLLPSAQKQRWVARVSSLAGARAAGLVPITGSWAIARGTPAELSELSGSFGDVELRWAPARQLWLDQAAAHVRLAPAHDEFGLSGRGVIVGVIDTGADITHPALRNEDGTTRISWMLSFDARPQGLHPELEQEYGCDVDDGCAVLARGDLDALLALGREGPRDRVGHGTHVISTAAGRDASYPGVAPEAELIVVQSGGSTGSLGDADILLGARFIFDRAREEQRPAVINLSLGSGFGAHDGSSSLEQGLAELSRGPGRAIVVAAGNDGGLYGGGEPSIRGYPEPFGTHSEVNVPAGSQVRVSLLTPGRGDEELTGLVFVWIALAPDAEIAVGFDSKQGRPTGLVPSEVASGFASSDLGEKAPTRYDVAIFNGSDAGSNLSLARGNVVVVIDGTWKSGRVFDLVLSGQGSARLWLQSAGQMGPAFTGTGLLFPRARTGGTIGIPASHPDLIAVGASVNRSGWTDYSGARVELESESDLRALFSSAGPNQVGDLKPDLLAPGAYLVAAMSSAADPRTEEGGVSQFASQGSCRDSSVECLVVDDFHAVSSGTSMAAPVVAGAVALLFQRDPELTQAAVRRLLRAGTRAVPGETALGSWSGAGSLDIVGMLRAQDLEASGAVVLPTRANSRLVLANTFIAPRKDAVLSGLLVLRGAEDQPAGGFDAGRLRLEVRGGSGQLGALRAGLLEFSLTAPPGNGGGILTARLLFDDDLLGEVDVPIGLDPFRARLGFDAGGGCAFGSGPFVPGSRGWSAGLLALACAARVRTRRYRRAT